MSTRKPKSAILSPFDLPEKRLQLITVEVKRTPVAVNARRWQPEEALDLPAPAKKTLH